MFAQTAMPASQANVTPDSVSTATGMVRGVVRVSTVIRAVARPSTALDTPVLNPVSVNRASVLEPAQPTHARAMCVRLETIMVHTAGTNAVRILPERALPKYAPQKYVPPAVLKYVPPKYAPLEYVVFGGVWVVVVPLKSVIKSVVLIFVLVVGVFLKSVLVVGQTVEIAAEIDRSWFSLFIAYGEYFSFIRKFS